MPRGYTPITIDDEVTTTPNSGGAFVAPLYLVDEYMPHGTRQRVSFETLSQQQERLCEGCGNPEDDCACEPDFDDWDGLDGGDECDCFACREMNEEREEEEPYRPGPLTVTDSVEDIERWLAAHA